MELTIESTHIKIETTHIKIESMHIKTETTHIKTESTHIKIETMQLKVILTGLIPGIYGYPMLSLAIFLVKIPSQGHFTEMNCSNPQQFSSFA
jgi:hypothetical protein